MSQLERQSCKITSCTDVLSSLMNQILDQLVKERHLAMHNVTILAKEFTELRAANNTRQK
ncbi:hypothetical protein PAAG_12523 [Paracoccidioides lutzii Pb01]|uniref:Uncharacterized protein n=1 Tax=Paracoccidioides lutzii (strain ATCC MYA-826 / Pb01) TaxID=502779 RepID=A0A0A2V3S3_PARBA|nr:hypothetical protein PAAG_12523 [Paracoccidioides lutzii Pb01]KGQ00795.1 hypothetical protein PAAG_12523 [Paracoccidioides lutzii Pb01]